MFGGDTVPNKWFLKYATDADFVLHETIFTPNIAPALYNQPPQLAWRTCCEFHTSPQAFGKIMSTIKPKHAAVFHFFNEEATRYYIYDAIRETYGGPLSMATDLMVWNVTKDGVKERMTVLPEEAWPVGGPNQQPPPEGGRPDPISSEIKAGRWDTSDVEKKMLDEWAERHNLQSIDWRKSGK